MQKVRVYWNLHKKCWSIQDGKSGRVIGHRPYLALNNAKFVVRKGGQKRVRQEGKKNVHAFAYGYIHNESVLDTLLEDKEQGGTWRRVVYNPYKDDYFKVQKFSKPFEYKDIDKDMEYAVFLKHYTTKEV